MQYPPYANGPGYILSSDIAHYIISEFESHKLRVSVVLLWFNNPNALQPSCQACELFLKFLHFMLNSFCGFFFGSCLRWRM